MSLSVHVLHVDTVIFAIQIVDFWRSGNDPLMTFDPNKKKTISEPLVEHPSKLSNWSLYFVEAAF